MSFFAKDRRRFDIIESKTRRFAVIAAALCMFALFACSANNNESKTVVRIAVPYEERLLGINDEYYKAWLEAETGYSIEFSFIPQTYTDEYLNMMLGESDGDMDAVFFSQDNAPTEAAIAAYGAAGKIEPLERMIDASGTQLNRFIDEFDEYDLRTAITSADGHIYYMPALDTEQTERTFQTLWINVEWLEELGLTIPTTTAELQAVLKAFSDSYPDCAPLIGCGDSESMFACNFLMNAFTVCDPNRGFFSVESGRVFYPPLTDEWREGLRYCRQLYATGLLPSQNFTYGIEELTGICNDPRNVVGAFTTGGVSDILSSQSPQLLSRYLAVTPLSSGKRRGVSVTQTPMPRPGGIILANSKNKDAAFLLMDLMCGEDAFLRSHYGEPGVDWEEAAVGDISANGEPAVITINRQDALQRDDEISREVGPCITRSEYADYEAWKGYQVNQSKYMETRACRAYELYEQSETLPAIPFSAEQTDLRRRLSDAAAYVKRWMTDFITGEKDLEDRLVWNEYINGFSKYGLDELQRLIQASHDAEVRE